MTKQIDSAIEYLQDDMPIDLAGDLSGLGRIKIREMILQGRRNPNNDYEDFDMDCFKLNEALSSAKWKRYEPFIKGKDGKPQQGIWNYGTPAWNFLKWSEENGLYDLEEPTKDSIAIMHEFDDEENEINE